jgi:hypothetical protein
MDGDSGSSGQGGSAGGSDSHEYASPPSEVKGEPTPPSFSTPENSHCDGGGLIDVGGLVKLGGLLGSPGSLIDVEFGRGDGHHAAILDVDAGGKSAVDVSFPGSDIVGDIPGVCGLLDALFDDCSLLS